MLAAAALAGASLPAAELLPSEQPQPQDTIDVPRMQIRARPLTREEALVRQTVVTTGALVTQVTKNGPAGRAGLHPDDVVIAVGSLPVASPAALTAALEMMPPGTQVSLEYVRDAVTGRIPVLLQ